MPSVHSKIANSTNQRYGTKTGTKQSFINSNDPSYMPTPYRKFEYGVVIIPDLVGPN